MSTKQQINHSFIIEKTDEQRVKDIFSDQLLHNSTRKHVEEIIKEYVAHVEFMETTRKYAGMEIDARIFRKASYWITVILTTMLTSTIAYLLGHYLFK